MVSDFIINSNPLLAVLGTGMVVGVVVNKPSTPTQIAPAAPTGVAPQQPGMVVPVPTTLAPQQQPLLNPQQMAAPQQQSAAAVAVSSLVAPPGQDLPGGEQLQQQPQVVPPFLANTKEKTPMCLINELARYNKVRASLLKKIISVFSDLPVNIKHSWNTFFLFNIYPKNILIDLPYFFQIVKGNNFF